MGGHTNSVEEYNRGTGLWTLRPDLNTPRSITNNHLVQVDGNAYFFWHRSVMMWNQTADAYVMLDDLITSASLRNHKGGLVLHN